MTAPAGGKRSLGAAAAALALALAAGSAAAAPDCTPPDPSDIRGDAARGAALHAEHCAECHGYDGRAEVIVMHMDTPPRDQTDAAYMATLSDAFLYLAICGGGEAVGRSIVMPAWGEALDAADLRDLVAFVRGLSGT